MADRKAEISRESGRTRGLAFIVQPALALHSLETNENQLTTGHDDPEILLRPDLKLGLRMLFGGGTDRFLVKPALGFAFKGADLPGKHEGDESNYFETFDQEYRFYYLNLPVMFGLWSKRDESAYFALGAGPSFNLLTKAVRTEEGEDWDQDYMDQLDLCWRVEAEYGRQVAPAFSIGLGIFFERSLGNAAHDIEDGEDSFLDGEFANRSFGAMVVLGFGRGP